MADDAPSSASITPEADPPLNHHQMRAAQSPRGRSINFAEETSFQELDDLVSTVTGSWEKLQKTEGVDDKNEDPNQPLSKTLRGVKIISLLLIGAIALFGMVFSKVTFVSVTSRMYTLYVHREDDERDENNHKSAIFFQLVAIMIIPEIVCLGHCFLWGFIGKSSKTYPWPSWKSILLGLLSSGTEVAALCLFVFGVACKLPPSLTILLLNGIFWVMIVRHLIWDIAYKRTYHPKGGYERIPQMSEGGFKTYLKYKLVPFLETIALLMQLGALIAVPILLAHTDDYQNTDKYLSVYILIPLTLTFMSVVWSGGWMQEYLVKPKDDMAKNDARMMSGLINSIIKIIITPFVAYLCARILLNINITFFAEEFNWSDLELSVFLIQIFVSFVAYLFIWMTCALQSWAFCFSIFLSTPVSFVWYVVSVETNGSEVFPFIDEYFVDWNLRPYAVLAVASLLWISQILAFVYFMFQNSENVLTNGADLFWTPRYNGIFLEQYMLLNRKTDISGYYGKQITSDHDDPSKIAKDSHIFICSTMYHENEVEMKQLLRSINRIAEVSWASEKEDNHKYESHIFFDNACSGEQLNQWVMQLLGLFKDTLNINPANVTKLVTPYGIQMKYKLKGNMPFYIHLKDNSKVKNKKRWSQVMYMNYVLNYRMEITQVPKDKAFILTTDADVDFTSNDVVALLDILACDKGVGAVCARTHPLGSGPMVWYQMFDYAVGHWFQKAAEHILGCVLCCPGCFSVFRVSALEDILDTYSGSVENGFDFLTKDMGEDRWLCTLLIQAGWRLEYSALSENRTFCPETFEEFYKQRRRWVPSTIANLILVISSYHKITLNNDSISILFILYQSLLVFSTLISPATVILIIVSGLNTSNDTLDTVALVILCIVSVLYGVVCVYATEKTQINVAQVLTVIFSIIMAVVISGTVTHTIIDLTEGDPIKHTNETVENFRLPVNVNAMYTCILGATFIMAGILHFNEFSCLFHSFWYLLCLPSGYLFLTIYSTCNINNRSWGTREGTSPKSSHKSDSWVEYFINKWHVVLELFWRCTGWKPCSKAVESPSSQSNESVEKESESLLQSDQFVEDSEENELSTEVAQWLKKIGCEMYAAKFKKEGYTELDFIATMKWDDIIEIGVDKRGYRLKLQDEINKLITPEFSSDVPDNIDTWLDKLKLGQYKTLFKLEGYSTKEDVKNLKGLERADLKEMGINKKAHLDQLLRGLHYIQYPSDIEIQINRTKRRVEKHAKCKELTVENNEPEYNFWKNLADDQLKPESANLGKVDELKETLRGLRNVVLLVLLLTNIMWIVFLYSLVFPQLKKYNLPDRAFSVLVLAIFVVIICIQFIAMIFHRFVTLVHLLARTKLKNRKRLQTNWFEPSGIHS